MAPTDGSDGTITEILAAAARGEKGAAEKLLPLVYTELRQIARRRLARLTPGQTVSATDLVHECWLRISTDTEPDWKSRAHFFGAAANAMRNIMVEEARRKSSLKRDVARKQSLQGDESLIVAAVPVEDILSLNEVLERFEKDHPRAAQVVSLRFFTGLNMPEVAQALELSVATAERDWRFARAWLQHEMEPS